MSLYAILVYNKDYKLKHLSYDAKQFSYFERWGLEKLADRIIKRCEPNSYYQIAEHYSDKDLTIYGSGIRPTSCSNHDFYNIIITDLNYPRYLALQLLQILDTNPTNLDELYQSYLNGDKITQIKNELDESKIILLNSIESLLTRGDTIDDLLIRSQQLEDTSFIFADKTKDMNRCCTIF